jgi:hypothetical protein
MPTNRVPVDLDAASPPQPAPVIDAERIARLLAESRELVEHTRVVLAASARVKARVRADAQVGYGSSRPSAGA